MYNLMEQLLWRVPIEWHTADEELVEDDAHGPPVDGLAVPLSDDHLGGDVLGGAEHLLVLELLGFLVYAALVQVGGYWWGENCN